MQRIAIFLRNQSTINKFRQTILNTLSVGIVDEALLCSGFFQETNNYSSGLEFNLMRRRQNSPLKLTTVGLYSYTWKNQYLIFGQNIKTLNPTPNFTFIQKRMKGMNWHSKIFIAKSSNVPVVGVIGSSNITSRAFGTQSPFNYECDVIMWSEINSVINQAINNAIGDAGEGSGVIVANYDAIHPANQETLEQRLILLEKEILNRTVDF